MKYENYEKVKELCLKIERQEGLLRGYEKAYSIKIYYPNGSIDVEVIPEETECIEFLNDLKSSAKDLIEAYKTELEKL